jgi:hypothetical protein
MALFMAAARRVYRAAPPRRCPRAAAMTDGRQDARDSPCLDAVTGDEWPAACGV